MIVAKALDNAFRAAEEVEALHPEVRIRVRTIVTDESDVYSLPDMEFLLHFPNKREGKRNSVAYCCLDQTVNGMKRDILEAISSDFGHPEARDA